MTDEELGRRLSDALHGRIRPPETAPELLHEHLRNLRSMREVRRGVTGGPAHTVRNLSAIAASVAIAGVLVAGLLAWQSPRTRTGTPNLPNGVEMFGRIDAQTAWAEAGSDLYMTRDGGATWTKGKLPGGRSPAQMDLNSGFSEAIPNEATPTPITAGPAPSNPSSVDIPTSSVFPDHYYPTFIDADHGWLLSWSWLPNSTVLSPAASMTAWRTSDGGQTWSSSNLPGTYRGVGTVSFVDASHGWATILRTDYLYATASSTPDTGGGAMPTPTPGPTPSAPLPDDAPPILATSDGGVSWSVVSRMAAVAMPRFVSATEGWSYTQTGGSGTSQIAHSTDGGRTWSQVALPIPEGESLTGWPDPPVREGADLVIRTAGQHATDPFAAAPDGSATAILTFVSADDGRTWSLRSSESVAGAVTNFGYSNILSLPTGPFVIYSPDQSGSGSAPSDMQATFDGGRTWLSYRTAGLPDRIAMAEWESPEDVWVLVRTVSNNGAAGGRLYASHDRGATWTMLLGAPAASVSPAPTVTPEAVSDTPLPSIDAPQPSYSLFQSMGRVDANVGWSLFTDMRTGPVIRTTVDGGATWSEPHLILSAAAYVQFVDGDHGWAAGYGPWTSGRSTPVSVFRTSDGGNTWRESPLDIGMPPGNPDQTYISAALHFRDALDGELSVVLGIGTAPGTGGPSTSTPVPSATAPGSSATAAFCRQYSTVDGGASWSAGAPAPCLSQVTFVDGSFGYGVDAGSSFALYVTQDGGRTWTTGHLPSPVIVDSTTDGSAYPAPPSVKLLQRRGDGTLRALVVWGGSGLARTVVSNDSGQTWSTVGQLNEFNAAGHQVAALGENDWIALGYGTGSTGGADVRISHDAGLTWTKLPSSGLAGTPDAVAFSGPKDGWVAVSDTRSVASAASPQPWQLIRTTIYATRDGGSSWTPILAP